jgi:hypothetical protein
LLIFVATAALGQDKSADQEIVRRSLTANRINPHSPTIDGELDDPIWNKHNLHVAKDFTQMSPNEGEAPSESTWVAVAYDNDALYLAFWNFDSQPGKVKRQLVRRDRWSESDYIAVMVDPYHDHQSGCEFIVNASGVQQDRRLYNDTNNDGSWDAVWQTAVKMQPWGWSAEMKVPYHCLRFPARPEHTWGFNLARYLSREQEMSWWSFSPSTEGGYVSTFGHLEGLTGIKPATHLEIMPYSVTELVSEPGHAGNPDGRSFLGDVGFDIKYAVSSNMIFDATINPDFGQVELDAPVLNLSAFETWFPEKRPFFLEGAGMFDTPFALFYSRRIGRAPGVWPDDVDYYTDRPTATTILGATKLTGKLGGRTSVGLLTAATKREKAQYVNVDGISQSAVIEPEASYNVFRVKQDLFHSSFIGVLGTVAGQDGRHPATTGGIDWNLNTNNSTWGFSGQLVGSRTDLEKTGFGFTGNFGKRGGKHWLGSVGLTIKDPYLDINDLGFTSRNDFRQGSMWIQYRTTEPWSIFRRTFHNLNAWSAFNYAGNNIEKGGNYNFWLSFVNGWGLGGGININDAAYDDVETHGNGLWNRPGSWSWWANLTTDQRRLISFELNPGSGKSRDGTWWAHWTGVEFRPRNNMEFGAGVNLVRDFGVSRWVDNVEDPESGESVPIFADLDQNQIVGRLTASVTLRTNLSWQISGQMLLSGLDYQNYRRYLGEDQYAPLGSIQIDDYDFNYVALNSTMIVRWEYFPGSTLYFVWTRARSEVGNYNNLDLSRDLDIAFSSEAENIWLVKASYWWNL